MEINESVLSEVKTELAAAKIELERLKQLDFSSKLKEEEIKQAESLLASRADF